MLEGEEFVKRVVPSLSRLFASSDRSLRRNLLEALDTYAPHLTQVRERTCVCVCWGGGVWGVPACVSR
jgi:hypothetical protein